MTELQIFQKWYTTEAPEEPDWSIGTEIIDVAWLAWQKARTELTALRAERDALRELHAAVMAGIDKWCPTDDLEAALDRIDKLGAA